MTTYTIPGFSIVFDPITEDATSFTNTTFTIVAPDAVTGFSYTYDIPGDPGGGADVTITSNHFSATADSGGPVSLESASETELLFINFGAGNTAFILAFVININGTDTDFVFQLGGDPIPVLNTLADFNAFEATITGEGQITSGPFAPGAAIPYDSNPGTTISQDDTIVGTAGIDNLSGGAGNDNIDGLGGNDTLFGDAGNDTLTGGAGNDVLFGGSGNDMFFGGADDDTFFIGEAGDFVNGGTGTDRARVDNAAGVNLSVGSWVSVERIDGAAGNDTIDATGITTTLLLTGGDGADTLTAGSAVNTLQGGAGNDTLIGGVASDFLFGDAGADMMTGNGGNDLFFVDNAGDFVDGGTGTDRVRVDNAAGLNLAIGTWVSVERIDGDTGADTIDATGLTDRIIMIGNGGNDTLTGGTGNDVLFGNAGNDILSGGDGIDVLVGDAGADTMSGGLGDDTFFISDALDTLNGGGGLDRARITNGVVGINLNIGGWVSIERLNASLGNDVIDATGSTEDLVINGNTGNDTVTGGSGADLLFGSTGGDTLVGGGGNDALFGGSGADNFFGGAGDDLFFIDEAGDVVTDGGTGTDRAILTKAGITVTVDGNWSNVERVDGVAGAETINASAQTSAITLLGNAGNDTLTGGSANDVLFGNDGADTLTGGAGNDQLFGGGADLDQDTFIFADGSGVDTIRDWEAGVDLMDISGITGIAGLGDLTIDQSSGINTVITAGAETITLRDFIGTIDADDFLF